MSVHLCLCIVVGWALCNPKGSTKYCKCPLWGTEYGLLIGIPASSPCKNGKLIQFNFVISYSRIPCKKQSLWAGGNLPFMRSRSVFNLLHMFNCIFWIFIVVLGCTRFLYFPQTFSWGVNISKPAITGDIGQYIDPFNMIPCCPSLLTSVWTWYALTLKAGMPWNKMFCETEQSAQFH